MGIRTVVKCIRPNKKFSFVLFCMFLLLVVPTRAQDLSAFQKHWLMQGEDTLPYRLLLPENYDASKKYPLVIFLHGSGERGDNNEDQLVHGATFFLSSYARKKYPAIVVFPQCKKGDYWSNVIRTMDSNKKISYHFLAEGEATRSMKMLQLLLSHLLKKYPVQQKQIYAGGLSMGGMGTYELVKRHPHVFAAAFVICGGAHPAYAEKIKHTAWWIFHGEKDDVVLPLFARTMISALQKVKARVRSTFYPEANHNSWDAAFKEANLLSWVFSHQLKTSK